MARPIKQGIDYFSLDVDMDSADDRIFIMESDYGVEGFGILIKLLMHIYQQHGYYLHWDDTQTKRFSKKKNIDYDLCKNVIDVCINEGFFSQELYKKWKILSSRGIQKRFFEAMKRRARIPFVRKYLLLDLSEINEQIKEKIVYVNNNEVIVDNGLHDVNNNGVIVDNGLHDVNNNGVIVDTDVHNNPVNVDIGEHDVNNNGVIVDKCSTLVHKVKQSKVKQSRTNQIKTNQNKEKQNKENKCSPSASSGVSTPSKNPDPQSRDGPSDTNQSGPDGKKFLSPEDVQQEKDRQKRALKEKYPDALSDEELDIPPFFTETKARGSP